MAKVEDSSRGSPTPARRALDGSATFRPNGQQLKSEKENELDDYRTFLGPGAFFPFGTLFPVEATIHTHAHTH